jgi:hypothetical protein
MSTTQKKSKPQSNKETKSFYVALFHRSKREQRLAAKGGKTLALPMKLLVNQRQDFRGASILSATGRL